MMHTHLWLLALSWQGRLPTTRCVRPRIVAIGRWEEVRSGEMDLDGAVLRSGQMDLLNRSSVPLTEECRLPEVLPPERGWRTWGLEPQTFEALHEREYELLRVIQKVPGLLPFSLAVHYSLLPKVITPLLALIAWLSSMPRGASLIVFACSSDCVNTAIKWAVQRPRPRWYCPIEANDLISSCGAWEVDLSFPSAHTMFFGGLAACAAAMYRSSLWAAAAFGVSIGLSRNYLSMHWPTDTLLGLALGGMLGVTWGWFDPYARLMRAASPLLSLGVASSFTLGLLSLMIATRQIVPPVAASTRTEWFGNALRSLSPEEREARLAKPGNAKQLEARNLESKIPMLTTVWATLAITGFYPRLLPHASSLPRGSALSKLLQAVVGVLGLAGIASLKKAVGAMGKLGRRSGVSVLAAEKFADGKRAQLKALTYVGICAWTFLLSQIVGDWLLGLLGLLG